MDGQSERAAELSALMREGNDVMTVGRLSGPEPLLMEEVFSVYAACMYRPDRERYEREVRGCFRAGGTAFLCTYGGHAAGVLLLTLLPEGCGEITGIAVREGLRRRGIASALIAAARELLTGDLTAETDGDAIGFYRAAGFESICRTVSFPDGEAIRYSCRLRPAPAAE